MATTHKTTERNSFQANSPKSPARAPKPRREQPPRPIHWTREQYHRMGELGWFANRHVELIEGDIVEMSPIGSAHAVAVTLVQAELQRVFSENHHVRAQVPLSVEETSEPEPDVAVVEGKVRDYVREHPTTAFLVVEVSDTTLNFDRTRKAALYARAGVAEYWILNLKARELEVRTQPGAKGYANTRVLQENEVVSPLAAPEAQIAVKELLP